MSESRTENAVRNIIFGFLSKIYQMLVPFFIRWAIIHKLGAEYLGLNSLFVSILQVLNLAELGVGSAMIFSMYKPIAEKREKEICALLCLYKKYYTIIGIVVAIMGCVLLPFIPKLINGEVPHGINVYILYIINLVATVMSYWMFAYKSSILQAHQRQDVQSKAVILSDTAKYIVQISAIFICKNYYLFCIAIVGSQVLSNIYSARVATKLYPNLVPKGELDDSTILEIKQRIIDVFTSRVGSVVVNSVDSIVISAFLGLEILAIYQNYYYFMSVVFTFILVCLDACVAGIGNSLVTDSMEKNYNDFKGLSFVTNWICCVSVSCFATLYQPFMKLYAGENLLLPNVFVIFFCIYFYLYTVTNYWCVYKNAAGIWHADRFRPLAGAILNLLLNLVFVSRWGLYAIVLSTLISYLLVTMPWLIINLFRLLFKKNLGEYLGELIKEILVIVVAVIISTLVCNKIELTGLLQIVVYGIITVICSVSIYGIAFAGSKEMKFVSALIKKVFRK